MLVIPFSVMYIAPLSQVLNAHYVAKLHVRESRWFASLGIRLGG